MSLIAVMMVTAFPRLSGFLSAGDRDRAIRWVVAQNSRLTTQAVSSRQRYALRVDISGNRLSVITMADNVDDTDEDPAITVEPPVAVRGSDTLIPDGNLRITGVAFSDHEVIHNGTADIVYYEQGYSDRAIIYMRDGDKRFSLYIAPFLARVRVHDGHVTFRGTGRRS